MNTYRLYNEINPNTGTAPSWAYGAVLYQIFPDRFCNGNPANDVKTGEYSYGEEYDEGPIPIVREEDWNAPVRLLDVGHFYGGDLPGILTKLEHLKSLGVEAIYLNPIFVSPSNHRYDVADYEHVDPHITTGDIETTNAYFADFVKKCHENGIRVILDGVFNHCSSKHPFFVSAQTDPESPYRNWFRKKEDGTPEYWWNVRTLPKFDYENAPELVDYMCRIGAMWVSEPYCCDGWRLDVAPELGHSELYNHSFWQKFRKAVKKANPEAVILAETYDNPSAWLRGNEWDSCMNYRGFMDPMSYYLTGMEKHSDFFKPELCGDAEAFLKGMQEAAGEFSGDAAFCAMNEIDNHDHSRMITRTTKKVGRLPDLSEQEAETDARMSLLRAAAVLQFTWAGCPTIYYGDETALPGFTDPDSRRPYPWGRENLGLIDFYSYLARLHRSEAFRYGSLTVLSADILLYLREYGSERYLVAINPKPDGIFLSVPLKEAAGIPDETELSVSRVIGSMEAVLSVGKKPPRLTKEGMFTFTMPGYSAKVYSIEFRKTYHML